MKTYLLLPAAGFFAAASLGLGAVPAWKIQEVYSNARGDVQFVELYSSSDGQGNLSGLKVNFLKGDTVLKSVTFAKDVPNSTGDRTFLIGTANIATLYGVRPDLEIPANFLNDGADRFIDYAGKDRVNLAALPRDGVQSLNCVRTDTNPNVTKLFPEATPANFGGQSGTIKAPPLLPNPILFVTQFPIPGDFTSIASVFGNHLASVTSCGRGGDLYIRYPNGDLKNLTEAAGFGQTGRQGSKSISVREPCVHWNGRKALFSMVIGAADEQFEVKSFRWQIYEITGLGKTDTPVITKVPNQPGQYNNVSPIYGTDDRIIFTSDMPHAQRSHLYPQLDEYEEAPTVSGLWSLNPATGNIFMMDHAPSGDFTPVIDSFGRVIFTRWDHLQRDQQADADDGDGNTYGTFDYANESANAAIRKNRLEVFPEPRGERKDLLKGTNLEGHSFNQFFPWMINEDGSEMETLNHIGRHELHGYFNRVFNDDPNVRAFTGAVEGGNPNRIQNFLQIKEDPSAPGNYYGIDAPEFQTHAAGQILRLNGGPQVNPDNMRVKYITSRETSSYREDNDPIPPRHSGLYRSPTPLTDGTLLAVHTGETRAETRGPDRARPLSRYDFRLVTMRTSSNGSVADQPLTKGILKSISYWDPDVLVKFDGQLWEMDPVEVVARPRPTKRVAELPNPEKAVFNEENVDVEAFRKYLRQKSLAVIVSRDLTTRDHADHQQPLNLRVEGTTNKTIDTSGKVYDVSYLQIFQGDLLRGTGLMNPEQPPEDAGRRVLARPLHDAQNPPDADAPVGGVELGTDGSMAAFVPAERALSWQLTNDAGVPVVRERYWLTFQKGEIRSCTSCHGINMTDQANMTPPTNKPEALRKLLRFWKQQLQ